MQDRAGRFGDSIIDNKYINTQQHTPNELKNKKQDFFFCVLHLIISI
jgi:hypothetical protein